MLGGNHCNTLLAVGDEGLAMQFDGSTWSPLGAPSKLNLHGVLVHGKQLWLCGAKGTLLCREGTKWIDYSDHKEDIFGMAIRGKDIWLACGTRGAGMLVNNKIKIMRDTFAAFTICAAGDYLGFAGNDTVVRFDGKAWEGYGYGDNG
jgi:hypothetical protein